MDFNQIIHAWERKDLPEDLEEIQAVQKTILAHEAEMKKWEVDALSKQVKAYYNFDIGFCAIINADVERIIKAAKEFQEAELLKNEELK